MNCTEKNNAPQKSAEKVFQMRTDQPVIMEPTGGLKTIVSGADAALSAALGRGAYIIRATVQNNTGSPAFVENREYLIPVSGEQKRIFFHKVDISAPVEIEGEMVSQMVAVVTVIDNPLPLLPIVWAASIIGSLTAGWFFVDKVERFTTSAAGQVLTFAAVGIAALVAYRAFVK